MNDDEIRARRHAGKATRDRILSTGTTSDDMERFAAGAEVFRRIRGKVIRKCDDDLSDVTAVQERRNAVLENRTTGQQL